MCLDKLESFFSLTVSVRKVCCDFIDIQKLLWSKILGYTTYYVISLYVRSVPWYVRCVCVCVRFFFFEIERGVVLWSPPLVCVFYFHLKTYCRSGSETT